MSQTGCLLQFSLIQMLTSQLTCGKITICGFIIMLNSNKNPLQRTKLTLCVKLIRASLPISCLKPLCLCPLTQIKMTNLFTAQCNFPKLSTESLRFLLHQRPERLIHPVQGHFFVLRSAGGLHWSASRPERNKWFLKKKRSAGLLSPPDVFYFITEKTQRTGNQLSSACSLKFSTSYILVTPVALLSAETYDDLWWAWQENRLQFYRSQ